MTKKIVISMIVLFVMTMSSFGQIVNLDGYVFEEKDGKSVALVPFATVYYYNYDDTTKLEFSALSNMHGKYTIYNLRTGKYIVKIVAPGFKAKRQEIQFRDVPALARHTNIVYAQIALQRIDDTQIAPTVFQATDLIISDKETIADVITKLKTLIKNKNTGDVTKKYRILVGCQELTTKSYKDMNAISFKEIAKIMGDKNLSKTYIEYYNLSGKDKTLADGVFNIVFNGKAEGPDKKYITKYTETTDFFIK
jgi:hypothetical protein